MRSWVSSCRKLQAISASGETCRSYIKNVSSSWTLCDVEAKVVIGIGVARGFDRPRISRYIRHCGCVQNDVGGGNVVSICVAQIKFNWKCRTAIDRPCLIVEGANAVSDLLHQSSAAGLEICVTAVGSEQRVRADG